jgi:septal ring factor EnvC (AmiA/AmiB activator)
LEHKDKRLAQLEEMKSESDLQKIVKLFRMSRMKKKIQDELNEKIKLQDELNEKNLEIFKLTYCLNQKTDNLEKSQKNLKDIMVEFELMKIELQERKNFSEFTIYV